MPQFDLTAEEQLLIEQRRSRADALNPTSTGIPLENSPRGWGQPPLPNPATVTRLVSPAQWMAKQLGNLQAVGQQNYSIGITTPKKDPIAAGIAAQPAYEAKMRDPNVLKRREAGLRKSSMEAWSAMSETLGSQRLVQGVMARQYKVERFIGNFQPKLAQHLARIDTLPNVTDADREQRMVTNLRGLRALKGQG